LEFVLKAVVEHRVTVEVLSEVRAWLLGVDEAHLHTPPDKLGNQGEKGFLLVAYVNIEVLDVGCANPKCVADRGDKGKDF
jgi:hypothetical protein